MQTLDDEVLVYDLEGDIAIHLNETAALVWRNCDGHRTIEELSALVAAELGGPADENVVLMALDSLSEHGLIISGYDERDGAAVALSRRRFFRRVGVAGAAAMNAPVVFSMIVPVAAAAQSNGSTTPLDNNNNQFLNNPTLNRSSGSGSGSGDDDENDGSGDDDSNYP
jgi:hypothetical protein